MAGIRQVRKCTGFVLLVVFMSVLTVHATVYWDGAADNGTSVFKVLNLETGATLTAVDNTFYGLVWEFYKPVGCNRSEVHAASGFQAQEGDVIYLAWAAYVDMPQNTTTNAIFQWKAYGDNMLQNYPIVVKTISGQLYLQQYSEGSVRHDLWSDGFEPNIWMRFVLRLKVSRDPAVGWIEFWYNGQPQLLSNGLYRYYCRTLDADYCDPKWGIYGASDTEITTWVADPKIASTYSQSAPARVLAYQNCDYSGWVAKFGPGYYNLSDLIAAGGINDDLSSIQIPPGWQVRLYEDNNFSGNSLVLTADDSCLVGESFNDEVSSMIVESSAVVELFQNCNYGGWSAGFGAGDFTRQDIIAAGGLDNDASSISVPPGWTVILFDGDNFSGNYIVLSADDSCLVGESFNDKVSSMSIFYW